MAEPMLSVPSHGACVSQLRHNETDGDNNDVECSAREYIRSQLHAPLDKATWASYLSRHLEACAWIFSSLALAYFGNGEHDTLYVLRNHPQIHMPALVTAGASASVNVFIFLYVQIWVRSVRGVSEDPELAVPWAIPVAAVSGLASFISIIVACWGVWNWFTPVLGAVHVMGLIMFTNYVPSFRMKDHNE